MIEAPFQHTLNSERTEATLEIDGKVVVLTTAELENAMLWLGALRATMQPPVPLDYAEQLVLQNLDYCSFHPMKTAAAPPTDTGAVVLFRSSLFGWFQFAASAEFCRGLVRWLTGEEINPPEGTSIN